MNPHLVVAIFTLTSAALAQPKPEGNPADHLPPHIARLTWFGERADWSHDGKRLLFLSKTFGDAMELDVKSKVIRNQIGRAHV